MSKVIKANHFKFRNDDTMIIGRKDYFWNVPANLTELKKGDIVTVKTQFGHRRVIITDIIEADGKQRMNVLTKNR